MECQDGQSGELEGGEREIPGPRVDGVNLLAPDSANCDHHLHRVYAVVVRWQGRKLPPDRKRPYESRTLGILQATARLQACVLNWQGPACWPSVLFWW